MLAEKGQAADMLVMTATPIPRTLLLTQWGEMAVSRMAGKPAGRQPIATRILSQERLPEIVARLHEAVARGARAYWVVRASTGSEKDDSVAAEDRFAELSGHFHPRLQLRIDELNAAGGVHGRKIRLIVEDNGSQPQLAVRAVQKLIKSDNVFAIDTPPPTVSGMKQRSAVRATTSKMVSRLSDDAVMSRKQSSSAPAAS
mgnify:CR=1 FL=1